MGKQILLSKAAQRPSFKCAASYLLRTATEESLEGGLYGPLDVPPVELLLT